MASRPFYFKLEGTRPVACSWYEASNLLSKVDDRCLAYTLTRNGYRVSTAFLVFDHDPFGPEPVLWNTIATSPDGKQRLLGRYRSENDARSGHAHTVSFLELIG